MKKYLLGFSAIVLAVAFSAFTTKKSLDRTFKLTSRPNAVGIVPDQTKWTSTGTLYGVCGVSATDLACRINVDEEAAEHYFHIDGATRVLNTEAYAQAHTAVEAEFFTITQGIGLNKTTGDNQGQYYNINTLTPSNTYATLATTAYDKGNGNMQ
jgi:hypothetical protein